METSDFQRDIIDTDVCMKITMKATKGCVQLSSNEQLFADIWFKGIKTDEEENADRVDYCGPVETSNKYSS